MPAWIGYLFAWVVLMALLQKGPSGYLAAFLLLYGGLAVLFGALLARRLLARYAWPMASVGFLLLWWTWGGTYNAGRDLLATLLTVALVLLAWPDSRLWLRRAPARLRARWRLFCKRRRFDRSPAGRAQRVAQADALQAGVARVGGRLWQAWRQRSATGTVPAGSAAPPRAPAHRAPTRRRLAPAVVAVAALAVWLVLSGLDAWMERSPLPRDGQVLHPPSMPQRYAPLHVGLALSGGGYRAALVHAGVVDALGQLGVPVTHLSAVSGGAIIASYLSVGGSPAAFRDAVAAGRFRMTRDLLAAPNLVRLPSPGLAPGLDVRLWPFFDDFSRLDVQADLVDRVLLRGAQPARPDTRRQAPALMVCMTDLTQGLSVGAMDGGFLLQGPTSRRYFQAHEAIHLPGLDRLADRVAASGAFPGAFPARSVRATITLLPQPLASSPRVGELELRLADGGVRDNLGLGLLQAADALAREAATQPAASGWRGFTPPADWALDLTLVSDGGKFFQAEPRPGLLASTMRAIDLSGLETGALRPLPQDAGRPVLLLSALGTLAPAPDAVIAGVPQTALRDAAYQYLRPALLAPDVLDRLAALSPRATEAQAALQAYRRLPAGFQARLDGLPQRCTLPAAQGTPDCVWWRLVATLGEDIWQTTRTFIDTPTLSDRFSAAQAGAVYRFGQYLVLLRASQIRQALDSAAERHRPGG